MEQNDIPDRETIIYNGKRFHRYPNSKRRQHAVYYWKHDSSNKPPVPLHRQIWVDNFGEIPKGFHIHHKDQNTLNNQLDNLELISASNHAKSHSNQPERLQKQREFAIANNKMLQEATKKWRHSTEGKEWHSKHTKESVNKPKFVTCFECGKEGTRYSSNARFCSKKCGAKHSSREFRRKNPDYYKKKSV